MFTHTDALGRTTTYDYNDEGDISHIALPGGADWRFSHDALHQVRETTALDMLGHLLGVKDPLRVHFRYSQHHAGPRAAWKKSATPTVNVTAWNMTWRDSLLLKRTLPDAG
ncbi:hypothetical protein QMG90_03410 [Trabulsiella odontotermitis]|uniref:hypothetical protein n=1 Tax=Trabulsiella odontotermitis TaxID=379893 RepID=UPI0024B7EEA7|nr:hypothetical protein [Trabulsiella odontotermitis]WHP32005.1 hypothetical protein QMG90_03410 [Trabulsiella odontotermitis]